MATEKDMLDIIAHLRAEQQEAKERLIAVEYDLAAAGRAIELLREYRGSNFEPDVVSLPASALRDMTQIEALRAIASYSNGILVITEAKRLLIASGLAKGKHVSQAIYAQMNRHADIFEWEAPGRYRLVTSAPIQNGYHQAELPNTKLEST